ncbi:MAG: hypothetical protein H7A39_01165 [Chlamydiales bacterium]|nr:hypothetical protein [Chlamydiales bacterium]
MKTRLMFGCFFAALTATVLHANCDEPKGDEPKDEFFNLVLSGDDETNKEGYLFAFADNKGVSFRMINEEIASADEEKTEETAAEEEAPQAEEV